MIRNSLKPAPIHYGALRRAKWPMLLTAAIAVTAGSLRATAQTKWRPYGANAPPGKAEPSRTPAHDALVVRTEELRFKGELSAAALVVRTEALRFAGKVSAGPLVVRTEALHFSGEPAATALVVRTESLKFAGRFAMNNKSN